LKFCFKIKSHQFQEILKIFKKVLKMWQ